MLPHADANRWIRNFGFTTVWPLSICVVYSNPKNDRTMWKVVWFSGRFCISTVLIISRLNLTDFHWGPACSCMFRTPQEAGRADSCGQTGSNWVPPEDRGAPCWVRQDLKEVESNLSQNYHPSKLMIYDDWWFMMIDDWWWFMMIYDDLWWFKVVAEHEQIWVGGGSWAPQFKWPEGSGLHQPKGEMELV